MDENIYDDETSPQKKSEPKTPQKKIEPKIPPQKQSEPKTQKKSEPRGLPNIGNTCFLNTALQMLFSIDNLRKYLENKYRGKSPGDKMLFH